MAVPGSMELLSMTSNRATRSIPAVRGQAPALSPVHTSDRIAILYREFGGGVAHWNRTMIHN